MKSEEDVLIDTINAAMAILHGEPETPREKLVLQRLVLGLKAADETHSYQVATMRALTAQINAAKVGHGE